MNTKKTRRIKAVIFWTLLVLSVGVWEVSSYWLSVILAAVGTNTLDWPDWKKWFVGVNCVAWSIACLMALVTGTGNFGWIQELAETE